jgi:hypothetical protein
MCNIPSDDDSIIKDDRAGLGYNLTVLRKSASALLAPEITETGLIDWQPVVTILYVIIVLPTDAPVTTPPVVTLATDGLEDDHVPPGVVFVRAIVLPTNTSEGPAIGAGVFFTKKPVVRKHPELTL